MSEILNKIQIRALNNLGDVMCPGGEGFVGFSELGAVEHVDLLLLEIPPSDLSDLKLLLFLLGFMPAFVLRFMLNFLERNQDMNGDIGALIRMVRFGLRGIIFSLYYSGLKGRDSTATQTPVDAIGYTVQMKV